MEENSWMARQKREEKQVGVKKNQNGKLPNPQDGITGRFLPRAAMQKPVFLCVNLRFDVRVGSLPKAKK